MTERRKILVLDAQSNQALACVRSLGRAGYPVVVASEHRLPLGAWSRFCQAEFRVTGYTVQGYASLRRWAHGQGVSIVLPVSEESCFLCNVDRHAWEALGMTIGCGPAEMLMQAFDKAQTLSEAEACGIPIPQTRSPKSLEDCHAAAEAVGFPCIIKPRFSRSWEGTNFAPSFGTGFVADHDALEAAVLQRLQGDCWPLIQQFVQGKGVGVFALYDHGRPVAWFAQESLRPVRPLASPNCLRRSIRLPLELKAQSERLLSRLRWHGPAMVEYVGDEQGRVWLMEVNGRFWVSLQLAVAAGVDFPDLWVRLLTGGAVVSPPSYSEGVILRWLWGDTKRLLGLLESGPPAGYPIANHPTIRQALRDLFGRQPFGTRLEMWQRDDPLPAIGEWLEGFKEMMTRLNSRAGQRQHLIEAATPTSTMSE